MKWESILTLVVGGATIIGVVFTGLSYCSLPTSNQQVRNIPQSPTQVPRLRPSYLPIQHRWENASGPKTFSLQSSSAVIEQGKFQQALHVRFRVTNISIVPVKAWVKAESQSREKAVEAWTIDASTTICEADPDQFAVVPVGDPSEQLVKYNESGSVIDRAPLIAPKASLVFSASFDCKSKVKSDAALFATIRLTFANARGRRVVYFQTNDLSIYREN